MKNKKTVIGLIALAVVVALMLGAYFLTRPEPRADGSAPVKVTVTVVHKNGEERDFQIKSSAMYLGELLVAEGIVEGEAGPYGLMISAADGEVADWNVDQSYWAVFIGEEYATTGVDEIPLYDGSVYKLVYTIG